VDSADDLRIAFEMSDRAASLALEHFEAGVSATVKADGTPVTKADRAVEQLFREMLSATRPDDGSAERPGGCVPRPAAARRRCGQLPIRPPSGRHVTIRAGFA
jgi:3'-phosphoadenosine 5'-phosphosulfate (PAPS) 3'-phosphatase